MLLVALLQTIAFAMLATTMHSAPPALKRLAAGRHSALTIAGWSLLTLSLIGACYAAPLGPALLCWCGTLSLAGAAILMLSTAVRVPTKRSTRSSAPTVPHGAKQTGLHAPAGRIGQR